MLKAECYSYLLKFNLPSGTSRGILTNKPSWFLKIWNSENPQIYGIGECSPIEGLSIDPLDKIEAKILELCTRINDYKSVDISEFPCINFGLESALLDLKNGGKRIYFDNSFSSGDKTIKINGLIWMNNKNSMLQSIDTKIQEGFNCIKLKIGAINFKDEIDLLKHIRNEFNAKKLEIRVDANGAFSTNQALSKIEKLSKFDIHSIEQPIQPGQHKELNKICSHSAIDVALDEELIYTPKNESDDLLSYVRPKYIILKPSLIGGIESTKKWISAADKLNISWWMTSALESNVGLNAIAQLTSEYNNPLPQGLGTGQIYQNNIPSFLELNKDRLAINHKLSWDFKALMK